MHEAPGVAAIGEDAGDEGEALAGGLERQLGTVTVLDVSGMDADGEEPTIGVGQDMALATGDLLARIIAFVAPF